MTTPMKVSGCDGFLLLRIVHRISPRDEIVVSVRVAVHIRRRYRGHSVSGIDDGGCLCGETVTSTCFLTAMQLWILILSGGNRLPVVLPECHCSTS